MSVVTGWHYTSLSSWVSIVFDGAIRCYDLGEHKIPLADPLRGVTNGIFVWPEKATGESLYGTILDRVIRKREFQVVRLEVAYAPRHSALRRWARTARRLDPECTVALTHKGEIYGGQPQPWVYHRAPFDVVLADISIERVRLDRTWDLAAYLDDPERLMA